MNTLRAIIPAVLLGAVMSASAAVAQTFPLSISLPESGTVEIGPDDLKALPMTSYETSTIWTEGVQKFDGVLLVDLLETLGLRDKSIRAVALNDYAANIPDRLISDTYPMIAYHQNGEEMPVRDKGPYWIVFPYDDSADLNNEDTQYASVWQLILLEVQH